MSNDERFEFRLTSAEFRVLEQRAKSAGLSMAAYLKAKAGLTRDRMALDAAAGSCDNAEHAFAVESLKQLMPHLAAASVLLGKIRGDIGGQADMAEIQEEARKGRAEQKAAAADSAPARELSDLLPSDRPSMRGSSLAGLVNEIRTPRKGRK